MILDGGIGAPRKVLEAYMGEVGWPANPPKAERHNLYGRWSNVCAWVHNMVRIVVVLLQQHDDQLNIGLL